MAEPARIVQWDSLHPADCPLSIEVLTSLRAGRNWAPIGMRLGAGGCLAVCFEVLLQSYLSTTEKATIKLVQAVYRIEGKGGFPQRVRAAVEALMMDLLAS